MKKYLYILVATIVMSSCSDFLDVKPNDFLKEETFYKTEKDLDAALVGVYDVMGKTGTYGRTLFFELDMSDESFNNLSTQIVDFSLNNYDASDVKAYNLWTLLYDGIKRANLLLENIDKAEINISDENRAVIKGQTLFLRAYYHFLITSNWGDVPLRLKFPRVTSDVHQAKETSKVVFDKVIEDMEASYPMVRSVLKPDGKYTYVGNGRVTKSVVAGILARVNLKMAGYPLRDKTRFAEARKWALVAMDPAFGHDLNPDYKQIFINHCQDKYDLKECLWEVEFGKSSTGGQEEEGSLGSITGIGNSSKEFGYSYGAVHCTERYYKAFGDGDLRRDWAINDYYYQAVTNIKLPYTAAQIYNRSNAKWRREYETAVPKNQGTTPINFPLLRFSDVLLMFAEADNEVNNGPTSDAYKAINKVRSRAYGLLLPTPPNPTVDANLPSGLDILDFRTAIQKERSLELGFEGLRRFDLIRWGIYLSTMRDLSNEIKVSAPAAYKFAGRTADNTSERNLLLPIPSTEMSLNKLITEQNMGW